MVPWILQIKRFAHVAKSAEAIISVQLSYTGESILMSFF